VPEGATVAEPPIRIGISTCLLGEPVRFDGGHKRDSFLVDTFGRWVEWVPVCPEVEIGLGTPRETIRLRAVEGAIRLVTTKTAEDLTERMTRFARKRVAALDGLDLSGYVLKKDSPTCGMERVKVYDAHGTPARTGVGLYAAALRVRHPLLPIEEEGRLSDPRLRENFVERVFAYRRMKSFFAGRWTVGGLVRFHTAHKLLLMSHAPAAYQELGRLVASAKGAGRAQVRERYERTFMQALGTLATARRHTNVLQHMAGYFRDRLEPESRKELAECIDDYRRGLVPLIVPVTLMRHHVRALGIAYLAGQLYLEPHPKELMLRNHV
jgi:uncharacterized protein YbgA (DUF1722 family)/uncharacterized protein YbbK (DUF523 family)